MTIELNKPEIELIDQALEVWEKEEQQTTMMTSLFSAILCPPEQREKEKATSAEAMKKAKDATTERRMKATLIRARLFQALTRQSEHDVDPVVP